MSRFNALARELETGDILLGDRITIIEQLKVEGNKECLLHYIDRNGVTNTRFVSETLIVPIERGRDRTHGKFE
jgi:hypothetical protein